MGERTAGKACPPDHLFYCERFQFLHRKWFLKSWYSFARGLLHFKNQPSTLFNNWPARSKWHNCYTYMLTTNTWQLRCCTLQKIAKFFFAHGLFEHLWLEHILNLMKNCGVKTTALDNTANEYFAIWERDNMQAWKWSLPYLWVKKHIQQLVSRYTWPSCCIAYPFSWCSEIRVCRTGKMLRVCARCAAFTVGNFIIVVVCTHMFTSHFA